MEKPNGIITSKEAKLLCERWMKTRGSAVDRAAGKEDNCSCWWSLDDLRKYLDYTEKQAKKLNYTMDGVRIYLGAYGDKAPIGKAGYTTMFISPTGKKTNTIKGSPETIDHVILKASADILEANLLNDGDGGDPPSNGYPKY